MVTVELSAQQNQVVASRRPQIIPHTPSHIPASGPAFAGPIILRTCDPLYHLIVGTARFTIFLSLYRAGLSLV